MLTDDSDQKIPIWLFVLIGVGLCAPLCLVLAMVMRPSPPTAAELKVAQQVAEREAAVAEQRERDVAKERAAATAGSPQVKAGGEYVVFDAHHVKSFYNLDEFKLTRIQVWNFGEIDLVEVDHQQNERSGEVRGGKIIAKNADTEIRKPVKIPHLTPGVFVGFEENSYGVWIDFGDIQVCFKNSLGVEHWKRETGVLADGETWRAETLDAHSDSIRVRVSVADKNGGQKWDTWLCRFRDKQKTAHSYLPSGFLVYKGGIRRDEKKVEELKERRASGRVVE